MEMEMEKARRVCVTGASGYIGSWLVKKLLEQGHVVHATLRNLGDESKVGHLKSLPGAEARLCLFESDLYAVDTFEPAIQGCMFVFLVATPMQHSHGSQHKDTSEAAVAAVRTILRQCERSRTVKRVIYTGSVTASSPLKEDGTGFKDFMDESSWTPLHLSYAHSGDPEQAYTCSKTLSEREVVFYNDDEEGRGMEVVSLTCGLVGGDTLLPYLPQSMRVMVSPVTGEKVRLGQLKFLQALLGSVPLVHIEDVCEAHTFCMEMPSMAGRFLCARAYPTMREIVDYYSMKYPELTVTKEVEGDGAGIPCNSTKLADMGFKFKYIVEQVLDDSVACAKRLEAFDSRM